MLTHVLDTLYDLTSVTSDLKLRESLATAQKVTHSLIYTEV